MDYQEEYILKNKDLHSEDSFEKARNVSKLFLKYKKDLKVNTILDIACGNGLVLLNFLGDKYFQKVTAVDISKKAIEMAKLNDKKNKVGWHVLDILKDDIEKYDLVLSIDIIEHVDDEFFLKKIKNFGKYFIFKVPIEDNFLNTFLEKISFGKINQKKDSLKKYGHINYYTEETFLKLLNNNNYKVLEKLRILLPKRSRWYREFLRINFLPVWFFSKKFSLKLNGGFLLILSESKDKL